MQQDSLIPSHFQGTAVETAGMRRKHQRVMVGQDEDISLGGMFLSTNQPLPIGSRIVVDIAIEPPSEPPVRINAVVRWRKRWSTRRGMGVEFIGFEAQGENHLKAWLDRLSVEPVRVN